ncbi:MAG: hypothetical protein ABSC95_28160 [Acetobacteraceae bacterium]|jgi:hypothetical protein
MMEEPGIIQMNIDRYREMLTVRLDDDTRARVEQLLGEARCQLALAMDLKAPGRSPGSARCREMLA